MINRKDVALLSIVGLLALSATLAQAQSPTTGRIEGIVKDQNGAVIVGAVVKAINRATEDERAVNTDETGRYLIPLLPPGVYRVSISASGFNTAVFDAVHVLITETTLVNANLVVQGVIVDPITVQIEPLMQTDG